ncbi:acetamidase/formamidase family protein [Sphingomonas sp. R-74633]|uniref:acetamidase/formamidase family protein n=1 Tax=Sphingomonas sp. R-74633 TaxID=2751188 RepID=UPI0015D3459B|nr:acetamidase/formamidase family protein [Sphingomonas sp. R-74633]NYT42363.1 acetamidase/formamidase family protein [Sphingomonas sp. R-74633]
MRLLSLLALLFATPALAQEAHIEHWVLATDMWGTNAWSTLDITRTGDTLTGTLDGDPLEGTVRGKAIRFTARDSKGTVYGYAGALAGEAMAGDADMPDSNHAGVRIAHRFTARRLPERPAGGPKTWDYAPTSFSNLFSADRAPVLTIWPGDSVRTSTIDSGGVDDKDVTRALFGNPQTGPFFIAGAAPGDTLAVHIVRLTPNRDWADSLDTIVGRALGGPFVAQAGELGKPVRWTLDREKGVARPAKAEGGLKDYAVLLRPMLGGLGVAPGFGSAPLSTGDTARTGGNMDFPEVVAGNTVYLPVQQPGALLYLGDAHALQGDGETSQYALETSMDVEFRVELIKGRPIGSPRVESPTELMVLGQAGSLDEALKAASAGLTAWLQRDYGLTLSETAQVLGTAMRYSVPNLAGRSVGVAARIDKKLLPPRRD